MMIAISIQVRFGSFGWTKSQYMEVKFLGVLENTYIVRVDVFFFFGKILEHLN